MNQPFQDLQVKSTWPIHAVLLTYMLVIKGRQEPLEMSPATNDTPTKWPNDLQAITEVFFFFLLALLFHELTD